MNCCCFYLGGNSLCSPPSILFVTYLKYIEPAGSPKILWTYCQLISTSTSNHVMVAPVNVEEAIVLSQVSARVARNWSKQGVVSTGHLTEIDS